MTYIKLEESSILHVPVQKYERDFTFIINGEKYETNRIIADLLSPKISNYHLIDPTINSYIIDSKHRGNFSTILNLIKFDEEKIQEEEIPFILEILENLENTTKFIKFQNTPKTNKEETTDYSISKTLNSLLKHQEFREFYQKEINDEIINISKHFYEIEENDKTNIFQLDEDLLEEIFNYFEFTIDNEDEFLEIIHEIYLKDRTRSNFYSYVEFNNVSNKSMKKFLEIFSYEDITINIWYSISKRLSQEIKINENDQQSNQNNKHKHKYKNKNKNQQNQQQQRNPIKTFSYSSSPFEGIINYFNNQSNLKNEIDLSYSSKNGELWGIFIYDGKRRQFYTDIKEDPWLCIEFKQHEIKPTHYTIRSGCDSDNPKSFTFEGSNDKKEWKILDTENEINYLKDELSVHTFSISTQTNQSFKYLRLHLTGNNWCDRKRLQISSIEIFGDIF